MAFDRSTNKIYKNEQEEWLLIEPQTKSIKLNKSVQRGILKKGKSKTRCYSQNVPNLSYSLLQHLEESKECHLSGKDKQKTGKAVSSSSRITDWGKRKREKGKEGNLGYKCQLCYTLSQKPLLQIPCLRKRQWQACLTKSRTWNAITFQQGIKM